MYLSRSLIVLFVCLVVAVRSAEAQEVAEAEKRPAGRFALELRTATRTHARMEDLRAACRTSFDVRGCTSFPLETLECSCVEVRDSWVLEGAATIESVIHVSTGYPVGSVMLHERAHLADLEAGLRAHLDGLEERRFGTKKACSVFAGVIAGGGHLRVVMNRLRAASNVRFGCDRKGRF